MTTNKKRLRIGILVRRAFGRARSLAALGGVRHLRARPRKMGSGAHRHLEGRPAGSREPPRTKCSPRSRKMLKGKPALGEVLRTGDSVDALRRSQCRRTCSRRAIRRRKRVRVDVVFPVLHGTFGEDGAVQGLLDLAGLPYVGSGVLGSAVGMDKDVQKRLFLQAKLPVGRFSGDSARGVGKIARQSTAREIRKKFRFPVFVKPATLGSSVGMTKAHDAEGTRRLNGFRGRIRRKDHGGKEKSAAAKSNSPSWATKIQKSVDSREIIPHREFYDYAAKYLEEGTRLLIPAKLDQSAGEKIPGIRRPRVPHTRLCWGWRAWIFSSNRTGKILLNEINTIPGFTRISMYPKLWEASGLPYSQLSTASSNSPSRSTASAHHEYTIELPAAPAPERSTRSPRFRFARTYFVHISQFSYVCPRHDYPVPIVPRFRILR